MAAAEIYYWLNRKDIHRVDGISQCIEAEKILFHPENVYTVDTVLQCRDTILRDVRLGIMSEFPVIHIESVYCDTIISFCRKALKNLEWQQPVRNIGFGSDVNSQAIRLLGRLGDILDMETLKNLTNNEKYGQSAMEALKKLSIKGH